MAKHEAFIRTMEAHRDDRRYMAGNREHLAEVVADLEADAAELQDLLTRAKALQAEAGG